ncbi:MAG: DUF309 domain-containing protein [Cyanobacteria bacterium P01_E01_bin.42]
MLQEAFLQGIEQFNCQEFYACHDTLEALWMESGEPHRQFYQGILQIAVACYHLENHNWRGAVTLLGEGVRRIRDYQPDYEGIDVTRLFEDSCELLENLQRVAPDAIAAFVETLHSQNPSPTFPKIVSL